MTRPALLVAAMLSLAFAPFPFPRDKRSNTAKEDLKQMQGTWVMTRYTNPAGRTLKPPPITAVIEGNRMKFLVEGTVRVEWVITLDAARAPKQMGRTAVSPAPGSLGRCVYLLQGDTLTIRGTAKGGSVQVFTRESKERPSP